MNKVDLNEYDEDLKNEYELSRNNKDAAIRIISLYKAYPTIFTGFTGKPFVAVKNLELCVEKNTCFALLGHNGAGKTVKKKKN
jgi:ABC-type multidrug transport system ATPase subunit